jgi:beta-glucanase (GH16 family)
MSQSSPNLTGYALTYDDEFSSAAAFKWSPDGSSGYQTTLYFGGRTLSSNGEVSMYSDPTTGYNPFDVTGGALHITAAPGTNSLGLPYNTGMITTEGNFAQTWGYFEVRAQVAQGPGMWSAFYMLPADKSWPPEVDALEGFGSNNPQFGGGPNEYYHGTIAPNRDTESGGGFAQTPSNVYTGYHTYGVDIEPDHITWYFDGQVLNNVGTVPTGAGYDKPFYMIVALAVGGWVGQPLGETSVFGIDYIRAYSKDPNAHAVDFQALSSPDGVNTIPTEARTASGGGTTPPPNAPPPGSATVGAGLDALTVKISQDAFNGSAQYTISVDGTQIGGTLTASALHSSGLSDTITVLGDWAAGTHTLSVNFLNDAYGGTPSTDRNLYVDGVSYDDASIAGGAVAVPGGTAALLSAGPHSFSFTGASDGGSSTSPVATTIGSGPDALTVKISQDAFNGSAQYTIAVDGSQIGGTLTASALHSSGQSDTITVLGDWASGPHKLSVNFINDSYGGTSSTDRNLYVDGVSYDDSSVAGGAVAVAGGTATLLSAGAHDFAFTGASGGTSPPPTGSGPLTVRVSEDAFNGDAQFIVTVDGAQFGGTQTVTASHAAGQWQDISIPGTLSSGPHTVAVNFINDAWGGSAATDRNMYVQSITVNGETIAGTAAQNTAANGGEANDPSAAVMDVNGTATFHSTGTGGGSGGTVQLSTIVFHMSEDAFNGDAQFQVLIDGAQVGGVQTVTASHAAHAVQDFSISGNFGTQGPGHVDVVFLNDAWGGTAATDRNLYVQSIDVNGVHFAGNTAANNAANGMEAADPTAAVMAINGTADFNINHTAPPLIA